MLGLLWFRRDMMAHNTLSVEAAQTSQEGWVQAKCGRCETGYHLWCHLFLPFCGGGAWAWRTEPSSYAPLPCQQTAMEGWRCCCICTDGEANFYSFLGVTHIEGGGTTMPCFYKTELESTKVMLDRRCPFIHRTFETYQVRIWAKYSRVREKCIISRGACMTLEWKRWDLWRNIRPPVLCLLLHLIPLIGVVNIRVVKQIMYVVQRENK